MNVEIFKRIPLKFSMFGKAISTSFLMYIQENKQRHLKSIPQKRGYPDLARSRSKCR